MLIAPHPDDEALACSVVLQRAVHSGAAIRVVYATDGDDNPWPQRVFERKWRLTAIDRKRWAKLRRVEALAALRVLGVRSSDARFLALPDQGLTDLLKRDCRSTLERLAFVISNWGPTDLLVPSISDTHPDHSALAVMLRLVLAEFPESRISVWGYTVHGKSAAFFKGAQPLRQSQIEKLTKQRAIRCHKTQIKLSRRRFLAYAKRPERFLKLDAMQPTLSYGSIRSICKKSSMLHLKLELSMKLVPSGEPTLLILGRDIDGRLLCASIQIPARSSRVEMRDLADDRQVAGARYRGNAFAGEFRIPIEDFSANCALFVKLQRRLWFFDEAGWLEIPRSIRAAKLHPPQRGVIEEAAVAVR